MAKAEANAYLKTQIMTAPLEKLQLMLYEGAVKFANQAREKILEQDYEASYNLLVRAQNIVLELLAGLRPELNPSLCGRLSAVYAFVYNTLVEANVRRDTGMIDAAVSVLTIQRNIWVELLEKLAAERSGEPKETIVNA